MSIQFPKTALLFTLWSVAAWAQVNVGAQKPEGNAPFTMTTVSTFELPWRLAFLPDGRMLITEKVGPVWLVTQQGQKLVIGNTPPVYWQGQNGMLGVFVSPHYATDQSIYLTYVEPGDYGGGLALARTKLTATATSRSIHQLPRFCSVSYPGVRAARMAVRSLSRPTASICSSLLAIASA